MIDELQNEILDELEKMKDQENVYLPELEKMKQKHLEILIGFDEIIEREKEKIKDITKTCKHCGEEKLVSKFPVSKLKNGNGGYHGMCYACKYNKYVGRKTNLSTPKNKTTISTIGNILVKSCNKCSLSKPLNDFPKSNIVASGFAGSCKDCNNLYYTKRPKPLLVFEDSQLCIICFTTKPISKFASRMRKNRTLGFDKICIACSSRRYAQDRYKKKMAELKKSPEKLKIWRQTQVENTLSYKFKLMGIPVYKFTREEVIKRDGSNCYLCKKSLSEKQITFDHLIPTSRGGSHKAENVKVCCRSCNATKRNKTVSEFKKYRGDYERFRFKILNP